MEALSRVGLKLKMCVNNPERSWCLGVRHAPQPKSPSLASQHVPDSSWKSHFSKCNPPLCIFPIGCCGRAQSGTMLLTPRSGAKCGEGSSISLEDAAAPSNVGCSSEHPRFHLSTRPCPPSTLLSPPHFEGHANLGRKEMKTMVVSTAGPSLVLRPQFARHRFVLQKEEEWDFGCFAAFPWARLMEG